jgi:glycosyltransferase involved in cell wall biosynthesis
VSGDPQPPIAINARAAIRAEGGGVERVARELVRRLPQLDPARYAVLEPPAVLAHRAGHGWEQLALPLRARRAQMLFSPANTTPLAGTRNAVFVHDLAPLVEPRWYGRAYGAWHRTQLRAIARSAALAIAPSETVRDELVELLGMPAERTAVAPLGVDPRFFEAVDPEPLRRRLGLERPYVLALGTAIARKNLALLDHAAPALAAAGLAAVIAGGARGYMRDAPAGGARRLGYVAEADLPALYSGAGAFALPSLYEGFGLPCLEAMACGTPVVTTRHGALPETRADAALYGDAGHPTAFAATCIAAAADPTERERLTALGRAHAAQFTWEQTASRVNEALGAVLALP